MAVRVVDYAASTTSLNLVRAFRAANWNTRYDSQPAQLPESCGYVAAQVARRLVARLQPQGSWHSTSTEGALTRRVVRAGNNLLYGRNNATARDLDAGEVTVLCSSAHLEQEDNPLDLNDQRWGSVLGYDLFLLRLQELLADLLTNLAQQGR